MIEKNKKTEYALIDVARLFFCICIVFLHSGAYHMAPGEWYVLHCLLRLAVPFFFVVSGYFWGRGLHCGHADLRERLIHYINRLLYPYVVFSMINIVLAVLEMVLNGVDGRKIVFRVLRSILFYPYGALWYVWASMIAVILLSWFIKREKLKLGILLGIILYCLALLMNSYYFLTEGTKIQRIVDIYLKITTSARNGIFVGFIFMAIGVSLARADEMQKERGMGLYWLLLTASFIGLLAEVTYIRGKNTADDHSLFLSFLVLIPSLVKILLNYEISIKRERAVLCRNLSVGIYYLHRIILSIIIIVAMIFGVPVNRPINFVITLVICVALCMTTYKTKREPFFTLLK